MRIFTALLILTTSAASAQTPQLIDTLTALTNAELAAWQRHDKSSYLANRDPGFVYVGPLGIIEPGHPIDNLMRCNVESYSLTHVQIVSSSSETAILIAEQHQNATCFGMKQPPVLNITETYIRRSGAWKLLLRTEAAAMTLGWRSRSSSTSTAMTLGPSGE